MVMDMGLRILNYFRITFLDILVLDPYNNCNSSFLTNHRIKNQDIMVRSAMHIQNKVKKENVGKIYRKESDSY